MESAKALIPPSASEFRPHHLAKLQPTACVVGGFFGHMTGCRRALVFADGPPDDLNLLRQFFDVTLFDPEAAGASRAAPETPVETVVVGELSCADERELPEPLARAARGARVSVIVLKHDAGSSSAAERCLSHALARAGLSPAFSGPVTVGGAGRGSALAVIDNPPAVARAGGPSAYDPPASFRVAAVMAFFNEADVVVPAAEKLLAQGVEVYLIDNWSTDGSYEAVAQELGPRLAGLERFPADGPAESFDLHSLLSRKEQVARTLRADWFIHCDADEIRESPWPGVPLRDAIYRVEREGFNAINHTVLEFHPVDNGFRPGTDFEDYFRYFSFAAHGSHFIQVKTWKNSGQPFSLADRAGHQVTFEGRRVYPYKFLVKHYPVRSQEHGRRKVFGERRARYLPAARARGWHVHYDPLPEHHNFLKDASALTLFDPEHFHRDYLVQRLTGIGALLLEART
jgi:glycosyltransferase involved in cell wall biosynthesis